MGDTFAKHILVVLPTICGVVKNIKERGTIFNSFKSARSPGDMTVPRFIKCDCLEMTSL